MRGGQVARLKRQTHSIRPHDGFSAQGLGRQLPLPCGAQAHAHVIKPGVPGILAAFHDQRIGPIVVMHRSHFQRLRIGVVGPYIKPGATIDLFEGAQTAVLHRQGRARVTLPVGWQIGQ